MPFGDAVCTPQITTGNVRTTYDPYISTAPFNNNLKNPLGTTFSDQGGTDSVSGTTTQLPAYAAAVYKYVLYKSTANPSLVAQPGLVYYTDNTFTVVSGAIADGVTGTASDLAGVMMVNTTDVSGLTSTILNNGGLGSGVWICIGGFVKGCRSIASTAVGDSLVGSATSFTPARVASGTAPTFLRNLTALTAIASSASDVIVNLVPCG